MAIAPDQNLGAATPASSSTPALTTSATAASASKIYLFIGYDDAAITISSIGGGLAWTVDTIWQDDNETMAIASADATSGLASGTTITVTLSGSPTVIGLAAASFTGLAAQGSVVDAVAAGRTQFNVTTWFANNVVTTNNDDLILGWSQTGGAGAPTDTPGGSFIEIHDFAAGGNNSYTSVYQIVAATSTYNPTGTWSISQVGADEHTVAISYKASTAPVAGAFQ